MRNAEELTNRIARLSEPQRAIIEKLIQKLESRSLRSNLTVDQAVDEFEREHPELLHLLAQ